MSRSTKVIGFSLPPELSAKFEKLAKSKHRTKSEFFREMIELYLKTTESVTAGEVADTDLAKILQTYWIAKSQIKTEVIVVGLTLLERNGRILIVSRAKTDVLIPALSWVFPGGKLDSLDFAAELAIRLKERLNVTAEISNLIASRIIPESNDTSTPVVALYFRASIPANSKIQLSKEYKSYRWVRPLEVFQHFTTSTADEVTKYLSTLQKTRD